MRLLLHICCAVCIAAPIKRLKESGIELTGYVYNPNIHPLIEFRRRIKALKVFEESEPFPVIYEQEYGLEEYLDKVNFKGADRCGECYNLRLETTAKYAKENQFDAFSTTLLFSVHQNHEKIKSLGFEIAQRVGITFEYYDYRHLVKESQEIVSRRKIYKQSYCGCIFSEHERYKNTTKHLYKKEVEMLSGPDLLNPTSTNN